MSGAGGKARIRCAIYTRKSSDEGLEQTFNSLDAQREACAAYILSQASEGWTALPDIYDDGGLSGGTLERPALQRLLAEVAAGRVDIIVVYKVDRLTRSLLDFSKLVEAFDKVGTSFVSVTQSFNTTTSMGRLTLNMLLSFAQFEREVTAERIRDKIAASKAKGMWMGGTPPLGYAADGRSLRIVEEHAALVRTIFERYLELRNVRLVAESLAHGGLIAPRRMTGAGRSYGGGPLSRGQIYKILSCPTYVGEVHHSGKIYPGLHEALIPRDTWDQARALLASNLQGERDGSRAASPSLFAGKVVDAVGRPFATTHACKRSAGQPERRTRYRYYVAQGSEADAARMRVPAAELEAAVSRQVATLFYDPIALVATAWLDVPPDQLGVLAVRCAAVVGNLRDQRRGALTRLIERVRVLDRRIEIDCSTAAIAEALSARSAADAPATISHTSDVRLTRSGMAMRLVHESGAVPEARTSAAAIRLLLKARRWWARLRQGDIDISRLATEEQVTPAYVTRVVRLAFLAPAVVEAILVGRIGAGLDTAALVATGAVPGSWREQERMILPALTLGTPK